MKILLRSLLISANRLNICIRGIRFMSLKQLFCLSILVIMWPTLSYANMDEGLYDPLPPEGAVFVRFINLDKNPLRQVALNKKQYAGLAVGALSSYYVVQPGSAEIVLNGLSHGANIESGKFYSALIKEDDISFLEDPVLQSRAKSLLVFYNHTGKPLSLKTANGATQVIPPVSHAENGFREINAVNIEFALFSGNEKQADIPMLSLERGKAYTIVAYDAGGIIKTLFTASSTDTTK